MFNCCMRVYANIQYPCCTRRTIIILNRFLIKVYKMCCSFRSIKKILKMQHPEITFGYVIFNARNSISTRSARSKRIDLVILVQAFNIGEHWTIDTRRLVRLLPRPCHQPLECMFFKTNTLTKADETFILMYNSRYRFVWICVIIL